MQRIARLDSKSGANIIQTIATKKQHFAFVRKGKSGQNIDVC